VGLVKLLVKVDISVLGGFRAKNLTGLSPGKSVSILHILLTIVEGDADSCVISGLLIRVRSKGEDSSEDGVGFAKFVINFS